MLTQSILVILLSLGLVSARPGVGEDSLNHYVDLVLDNLQILIVENGLDPGPLPNSSVGFSDVVSYVVIASIFRSGDANFLRDGNGIINGISSGMGLGEMKGHYTCLAKFMDLGPIAEITVDVNGAKVYFEAALDRTTCRFHVSIMEVTKIGHINIDIKGLGPLNWIFEIVANLVVNIVKIFIKDTIEVSIQDLTNQILESIDLSAFGPLIGCNPAIQNPLIQPQVKNYIK
ncbi:putative Group 7 allergen-containing protein [Homarus americanus]|uniref:Putative Group 7 allergen-containing protein n=1 Tax=Homarus americanus TaxID=6706 RepID=A0A8J5JMQ6_HOMAM|nr:putative Group 7 allergen-containing protein [Homarus americanus]